MSDPASPSSRSHAALVWLIRGTGALVAIPSIVFALGSVIVLPFFIIGTVRTGGGWMEVGLMSGLMLVGLLFYGVLAKVGYDMFRKVNGTTISNFAFIFSVLVARTLYYFLPVNYPRFVGDYVGNNPFFEQGDGPGITYRVTLGFIVFLLFYNLIKPYLLRTLGLSGSNPPQNRPPTDPEVPQFPQKSPLVQL